MESVIDGKHISEHYWTLKIILIFLNISYYFEYTLYHVF